MNIEKVKKPRTSTRKPMSEETKLMLKQKREEARQRKQSENVLKSQFKIPEPIETLETSEHHKVNESKGIHSNFDFSKLNKLDDIENLLISNNKELANLKLLKEQKNKIKQQKMKLKQVQNLSVDKQTKNQIQNNINEYHQESENLDYSNLFR